jgi:(1->4)-alpha-D-glucan 1-alpha-D-glucosylmutase
VQLTEDTGFADVEAAAEYLATLGIGAVYASPAFRARAGSSHGYDVVDPTRIDPRLGGPEAFDRMVRALRRLGLGVVLDVVPNHMATGRENSWWMDVLEHGQASRFARVFDVDWQASGMSGKVLVPILGEPYGRVLEAGQLRLVLEPEGLRVAYYDHRLPVDPVDVPSVLGGMRAGGAAGDRFRAALSRAAELPPRTRTDARSVRRRARGSEELRGVLAELTASSAAVRRHVDERLARWSGRAGEPESFDPLDALLGRQAYRVSHWRVALHEIDYRRFFDIAELVSVRAQDPVVFDLTHALLLRLVRRGMVDGVRVDHVDGLHDPAAYLARLGAGVGDRWVLVEKVLADGEDLPGDWRCDGTTGYDFLRDAIGVLLDERGCRAVDEAFRSRTGATDGFGAVAGEARREVLRSLFDSELTALTERLHRLASEDRHARDLTAAVLREALEAVTAALPVYRTYVRGPGVDEVDRGRIRAAFAAAEPALSEDGALAAAFLRSVLLLEGLGRLPDGIRDERVAFAMRWQQVTGPVTAKGVEDTALYRDAGLLARNDVGVDPAAVPLSVEAFHRRNVARVARPAAMLTTSTHDTKRGEDARARLAVLSELPQEWIDAADRLCERFGVRSDGHGPDVREAWICAQAALSIWPASDPVGGERGDLVERLGAYMRKAVREAKLNSDWLSPDERHEAAVGDAVRTWFADGMPVELAEVFRRVAWHGSLNGIAQLTLRCTCPGVPDMYQGSETWDLTLVDPDNRRPVDLAERARALSGVLRDVDAAGLGAVASELLRSWPDGRVKLFVLHRLLVLRGRRAAALGGGYRPLTPAGPLAGHVVSFARGAGSDAVVVVVPRLTAGLGGPDDPPVGGRWDGTAVRLPPRSPRSWRDALTDRTFRFARDVPLAEVLRDLPVAALEPV